MTITYKNQIMTTLSTSTALSLGTTLDKMEDTLLKVVDTFLLVTCVDNLTVSIEYFEKMKILYVVIPSLEIRVAVHADELHTIIKLMKRSIFKSHNKPGYIRLVDNSSMTDEWIHAKEFELTLKNHY